MSTDISWVDEWVACQIVSKSVCVCEEVRLFGWGDVCQADMKPRELRAEQKEIQMEMEFLGNLYYNDSNHISMTFFHVCIHILSHSSINNPSMRHRTGQKLREIQ